MKWQTYAFGTSLDHGGQNESKEQQQSNKQQMAAPTFKNSKEVFIDEAFETGGIYFWWSYFNNQGILKSIHHHH